MLFKKKSRHVNLFWLAKISINDGEQIGETSGMYHIEIEGKEQDSYIQLFEEIQEHVRENTYNRLRASIKEIRALDKEDITITFLEFYPVKL